MREADIEVILERAKEKYPEAKPRGADSLDCDDPALDSISDQDESSIPPPVV
jgi:hypothetical protein